MEKIDCIQSPVCFPCIANRRINEILETVAKEKRLPTVAEFEEAEMFQRAMIADIQERSRIRMNLVSAIQLEVI
jgi:hypothetical protein